MSDLELHNHNPVDPSSTHILNMSDDRPFSAEKWIAMGSLTFSSVMFGILPYILFSYFRRVIQSDSKICKLGLAALSSISGGFLLATTMLHILPEVREKAEAQKSSRVGHLWGFLGSNVPVAELLMLYGFCLIYGLEEIAQFLLKCKCCCSNKRNKLNKVHDHNHSHPRQGFGGLGMKPDLDCDSGFGIGEKYLTVENGIVLKECQHTELIKTQMDHDSGVTISISDSSDSSTSCSPTNIHGSIRTLNTLEMTMKVHESPLGALRSLVSLLALSFHAIMEGIAVGVQDPSDLWMTFVAIASHKCIIALCLGMEMMKSNMNWKTLLMSILLFSVVSPVGILIGSVLISGEIAKSGWVVVIEGLASGTLLYIIFFEILPPDHHHNDENSEEDSSYQKKSKVSSLGILKFVGTCLGVFLAAYLLNLASHSHNHGHSSLGLHNDHDPELKHKEPHSHPH